MENVSTKRAWGDVVGGCRISLNVARGEIAAGEPVELAIALRNDGATLVRSPRVSIWFDYEYIVLGPDEKPARLTDFGKRLKESLQEQGGTLLDLKPGTEFGSTVEISRLYEFTSPGTYKIGVSKLILNSEDAYFRVSSNPIVVVLR